MVSSRIVSQYSGELPKSSNDRKIKGITGPLYAVQDVLDILSSTSAVAWSLGCIKDIQKWEFEQEDVDSLIVQAVQNGKYIGSEWCQSNTEGPWAACDSYRFVRREWIEYANKEIDIEYYIKVAINKAGKILLLASLHPSDT